MFCHRTLTITDLVTQYASFSVPHGVHLQQPKDNLKQDKNLRPL